MLIRKGREGDVLSLNAVAYRGLFTGFLPTNPRVQFFAFRIRYHVENVVDNARCVLVHFLNGNGALFDGRVVDGREYNAKLG